MALTRFIILVFGVCLAFAASPEEGDEENYKRTIPLAERYAFDNDFDKCMIQKWIAAGVLKTSPTDVCSSPKHYGLCYGLNSDRPADAQFISCYNTETLIPEFTAYLVPYTGISGKTKRPNWEEDKGSYAPNPQAQVGDYSKPQNASGDFFCSRGHLTPNGAFDTQDRRDLTFIITNVAPQWQTFNAGNWASVENAVKNYVDAVKHGVYVFTGTAGKATYWEWARRWTHKVGKITAPKYFWKAVCDPVSKQSIVFIAENNIDETSTTKVTSGTCLGSPMTKAKGVVQCESVSQATSKWFRNWWHGFKFPGFDATNCGTDTVGAFLNRYLKFN